MAMDQERIAKMSRIQKANPDLWLFFEGESRYEADTIDDLNCRRWQDTLMLAYFISISNPEPFRCTPGTITITDSTSYRDHHGDECDEFILHRVTKIDRERYMALRKAHADLSDSYKRTLQFDFNSVFYLHYRADILEDDYAVLPPVTPGGYRYQLSIVARVKNTEGYYLFDFNRE